MLNITLFLRVVLCFSSSLTLSRSSPTTSPTSTSRCNCTAKEEGWREGEGKEDKGKREGWSSGELFFHLQCRQCDTTLSPLSDCPSLFASFFSSAVSRNSLVAILEQTAGYNPSGKGPSFKLTSSSFLPVILHVSSVTA